jgi:dTDP-4-dehydrorhamnose reductase
MKILVIGASGMIGSAMLRVMNEKFSSNVVGTVRDSSIARYFEPDLAARLICDVDVESQDSLVKALSLVRPDVVINCAGLTKHKPTADDPLSALPINALMPHRLARLCALTGARFIHVSTDCVFSGKRGSYTEGDIADAEDVYGKSKILGEVTYPNTVTVRTSTIGRELNSKYGLLEWFLAQDKSCKGYKKAIFSGLPTVLFAQIVRDIIIPNIKLSGLFHVSAAPISKYDLLRLISKEYSKEIDIVPDDTFHIDRSLDSSLFRNATGYVAPSWDEIIHLMHSCE